MFINIIKWVLFSICWYIFFDVHHLVYLFCCIALSVKSERYNKSNAIIFIIVRVTANELSQVVVTVVVCLQQNILKDINCTIHC